MPDRSWLHIVLYKRLKSDGQAAGQRHSDPWMGQPWYSGWRGQHAHTDHFNPGSQKKMRQVMPDWTVFLHWYHRHNAEIWATETCLKHHFIFTWSDTSSCKPDKNHIVLPRLNQAGWLVLNTETKGFSCVPLLYLFQYLNKGRSKHKSSPLMFRLLVHFSVQM